MTRRLALMTTFAALALPAGALAKEPVKATVCGVGGCVSSTDRAAIRPLVDGGPPASTPTSAAPAYRVRVTIAFHDGLGAGRVKTDTFTSWMSPALGLTRGSDGTWMTLPATTLAALRRVAGGIRPFPAGRVPVGPRPTAAPQPRPRTPAPAVSDENDGTLLALVAVAALAMLAAVGLLARRQRADGHFRFGR